MPDRPAPVVKLDVDHGYPHPPAETPDFLRIFYAARRIVVNAARRPTRRPKP